jgi:hypothetical protein
MAEKTEPTKIFRVTIPDDQKFDDVVKDHVSRKEWNWLPTNKSQTHCSFSAYDAVRSSGVPLPKNTGQVFPGTLGDELDRLTKKGTTVKRIK